MQTDRDALLASIEVVARDHVSLWDEPAAKRPVFSDKLAAMRARGLPVEAPMRHWNREIVGRIALLCDVVNDQVALAESAQRAGLESARHAA